MARIKKKVDVPEKARFRRGFANEGRPVWQKRIREGSQTLVLWPHHSSVFQPNDHQTEFYIEYVSTLVVCRTRKLKIVLVNLTCPV
jgi:hypothetical protein